MCLIQPIIHINYYSLFKKLPLSINAFLNPKRPMVFKLLDVFLFIIKNEHHANLVIVRAYLHVFRRLDIRCRQIG
jgi:hypothetical protein